jgi:hypothetical protein
MKTLKSKSILILTVAISLITACKQTSTNTESEQKSNWVPLFNGENLDGWHVKITGHELDDNYGNTFRVEDGVMKVSYDQYESFENKFGHIFYKEPFSSYVLRVEYRFTGEQVAGGEGWAWRNSGAMIHSQSPESMTKDQNFPVSIEVQFLGGDSINERSTANLCTPGTNVVMNGELITQHCISSTSETLRGDQWVTTEIFVYADSLIKHVVNGDTVLVYEKPQIGGGAVNVDYPVAEGTLLKEGYISLQSESHPIEFRTVEIMDLEGCEE